ncbi:MAG: polysaccharide biosynthesis tyrosine autokinase [Verrucomicrobiota bacterium JB022]|nr:polysaccharide biosynthesis tyrosine autokinase [Verrucomicrobiota bacterium JB022]
MSKEGNGYGYGYGGGGYYGGGYYYGDGYGSYAESTVSPSRTLKDYFLMLRERIWWLIISVIVVFIAMAVYTFSSPKLYQSGSQIELLRSPDEVLPFKDVVNVDIRDTQDYNTQVMVLGSSEIVRRVGERVKGDLRRRFLQPYEDKLKTSLNGEPDVLGYLAGGRTIRPDSSSLIVQVGFVHPNPQVAQEITNLFAEEFVDFNRSKMIEGNLKATESLRDEAAKQMERIKDIERRLADFKEKYGTISVDERQNIAREQLLSLNAQKIQAQQNYDLLSTRWQQVESVRNSGGTLLDLNFISSSPTVTSLIGRLSDAKIGLAGLQERYREKHPRMVAARQTLQETQAELDKATGESVERLKREFEIAKDNLDGSKQRLAAMEQEIISLDRLRPEYNALVNDLQISRQMYDVYQSRLQQATVANRVETPTARIVDRASLPYRPVKPNVPLNMMLGLVLGGVLGIGLVVLLAVMDDKVKTAFDIESSLGLPLIGLIPRISRIDALEKARIVADNLDRPTVEAFRSVHSTLKLHEDSKNAKVIVTTSTVSSEGKSFVSTNLAITFANHGERTIIIDCDLRMPNVAKSLDLPEHKGVIDYINGNDDLDSLIIRDYQPGLDVLVSGGRSKSPTQALSSQRFENLIHELRMRYDKVIIDCPPLAPVSDALNVVPQADGVVYVIRFKMVKRKTASINIRRLRESNVPIFGAILNNINTNVAGYYYSHYYYDKSYQSYYTSANDEGARDYENAKREGKKKSPPSEEMRV